ncbi:MAG: NACHT domain-containing protein [Fischerella sp. CENA71]|nr:NACHT domain-containing protein [Fischerella sp. CENA71]
MILDPGKVITAIINSAAPYVIKQAQRKEIVIKVLKSLKLDPAHPPEDFDGVYAYALVEYGVDKPEVILKLFQEQDIKTDFKRAFYSDQELNFINSVIAFIDSRSLGDEIIKELKLEKRLDIKHDIRPYIEDFYKVFTNITKLTRTPKEVMRDKDFREILDILNKLSSSDEINAKLAQLTGNKPQNLGYSIEFDPLIKEKIRSFCGRKFVFAAFEEFTNKQPKGYFTLVGDAGMGKSAIAAKYVYDHKAISYFNSFAEGRTRPEQFLESIREQLISRYDLHNAEDDDLGNLLVKVSLKMANGERLVIVVDALDEVEQKSSGNLLNLPTTLPDKVYFLLTRRPYTASQKRLFVSPGIPVEELDLTREYTDLSREDIKEYIRFSLNDDSSEYKDGLNKWIQYCRDNITPLVFVEQLADKSENNFMYLRFVLPDIANDRYNDLNLKELPDGLLQYYQTHWERMGMNTKEMRQNAIILYVIVEAENKISSTTISRITNRNESEVLEVLEEWSQFLRRQVIKGEECYSMYHKSFTDFLRDKPTIKKNNFLLQDIQRLIVEENDRLWEEIGREEEED